MGGRGPRFVPASGFHFICEETGVPCSTGAAGGVCIYFGGRLLRANRTRKISNGDVRAFASPNFPPLGELSASRCLLFFLKMASESAVPILIFLIPWFGTLCGRNSGTKPGVANTDPAKRQPLDLPPPPRTRKA